MQREKNRIGLEGGEAEHPWEASKYASVLIIPWREVQGGALEIEVAFIIKLKAFVHFIIFLLAALRFFLSQLHFDAVLPEMCQCSSTERVKLLSQR